MPSSPMSPIFVSASCLLAARLCGVLQSWQEWHEALDSPNQHRRLPRAQVLGGEDNVEDSQELRDLCHFFDFIEGEVASSRNFEFTQVC